MVLAKVNFDTDVLDFASCDYALRHAFLKAFFDGGHEIAWNRSADDRIDPKKIIARYRYDHPLYDHAAIRAQGSRDKINGTRRTYFCGAYWGHGFHEDGVVSALDACREFNERVTHEELHLRRAS